MTTVTEAQIEAALMTHPYIETIKADRTATEADVYLRKRSDAVELTRRLGTGDVLKVCGAKQWVVRVRLATASAAK